MENSKKQTAVEELISEFQELKKTKLYETSFKAIDDCMNLAVAKLELEKQQIIDVGNSCALKQYLHIGRVNKMTESEIRKFAEEEHLTFGEQYYNETFNK